MSERQRDAVWAALPQRLAALSVRVRLLPWVQEELVDWVRDSVVARQGTWVVGAPGAAAEFPSNGDAPIDVRVEAGVVTAKRPDAAFHLRVNDKVRAFAFAGDGPIVLGLAKGRAGLPSHSVLRSLGPDTDAIDEVHRDDSLFDVGIGRQYSRFCMRTGDKTLASTLSDQSGRPWPEALPLIQNQLLDAGPHRIVESAAARIEVFAGPALTHFLPEFLKSGEEIAAGLALPDYAAPIAIFYPHKI